MTESLEKIWDDDRLGRLEDARYLEAFLRRRCDELISRGDQRAYVLNIDAVWGGGKTFFLKRLRSQLALSGHISVYVNAWENDFADDPLLAVMAAIDSEVARHTKKKPLLQRAWTKAKKSSGRAAWMIGGGLTAGAVDVAVTGGIASAAVALAGASATDNVSKVAQKAADATTKAMSASLEGVQTNAVEEFKKKREAISGFRNDITKFIEKIESENKIPSPLFILVDELDRCRPPFAISMLERIKHLFSTPRVVFVVATNSTELIHSIGAVYGAGFGAKRYLDRFFDRTYVFEKPLVREYVTQLMTILPIQPQKLSSPWDDNHVEFISDYFDHCDDDLRSIAKIYDLVRTVTTTWDERIPIELLVLLPIAAEYIRGDRSVEPNNIEFFQSLKNWTKNGHDNEGKKIKFNMQSLAYEMWIYGRSNISIYSRNTSNSWLSDRISIERNVRLAGRAFGSGQTVYSLIGKYPYWVRQAGRIAKADTTP